MTTHALFRPRRQGMPVFALLGGEGMSLQEAVGGVLILSAAVIEARTESNLGVAT